MAASLDSNLCIQGNQYPREKKEKLNDQMTQQLK